jgi:hypothetical protein
MNGNMGIAVTYRGDTSAVTRRGTFLRSVSGGGDYHVIEVHFFPMITSKTILRQTHTHAHTRARKKKKESVEPGGSLSEIKKKKMASTYASGLLPRTEVMSAQTFMAGLDKTPEAFVLPATPDYTISQPLLEKWIVASKRPDQARIFASTFRYVSFEMWRAALHTAIRAGLRASVPSAAHIPPVSRAPPSTPSHPPSPARHDTKHKSHRPEIKSGAVSSRSSGSGSGGTKSAVVRGNARVFYYPIAVDDAMSECKSNYWVTNLALRMLRTDEGLSGDEKVVRTADALAQIDNLTRTVELVLFDDAIYSGTQVSKILAKCMTELTDFFGHQPDRNPVERVRIIVVAAYASVAGVSKITKAYANALALDPETLENRTSFALKYGATIATFRSEIVSKRVAGEITETLGVESAQWATYFQHKMPDNLSVVDAIRTGAVYGNDNLHIRFVRGCTSSHIDCPVGYYKETVPVVACRVTLEKERATAEIAYAEEKKTKKVKAAAAAEEATRPNVTSTVTGADRKVSKATEAERDKMLRWTYDGGRSRRYYERERERASWRGVPGMDVGYEARTATTSAFTWLLRESRASATLRAMPFFQVDSLATARDSLIGSLSYNCSASDVELTRHLLRHCEHQQMYPGTFEYQESKEIGTTTNGGNSSSSSASSSSASSSSASSSFYANQNSRVSDARSLPCWQTMPDGARWIVALCGFPTIWALRTAVFAYFEGRSRERQTVDDRVRQRERVFGDITVLPVAWLRVFRRALSFTGTGDEWRVSEMGLYRLAYANSELAEALLLTHHGLYTLRHDIRFADFQRCEGGFQLLEDLRDVYENVPNAREKIAMVYGAYLNENQTGHRAISGRLWVLMREMLGTPESVDYNRKLREFALTLRSSESKTRVSTPTARPVSDVLSGMPVALSSAEVANKGKIALTVPPEVSLNDVRLALAISFSKPESGMWMRSIVDRLSQYEVARDLTLRYSGTRQGLLEADPKKRENTEAGDLLRSGPSSRPTFPPPPTYAVGDIADRRRWMQTQLFQSFNALLAPFLFTSGFVDFGQLCIALFDLDTRLLRNTNSETEGVYPTPVQGDLTQIPRIWLDALLVGKIQPVTPAVRRWLARHLPQTHKEELETVYVALGGIRTVRQLIEARDIDICRMAWPLTDTLRTVLYSCILDARAQAHVPTDEKSPIRFPPSRAKYRHYYLPPQPRSTSLVPSSYSHPSPTASSSSSFRSSSLASSSSTPSSSSPQSSLATSSLATSSLATSSLATSSLATSSLATSSLATSSLVGRQQAPFYPLDSAKTYRQAWEPECGLSCVGVRVEERKRLSRGFVARDEFAARVVDAEYLLHPTRIGHELDTEKMREWMQAHPTEETRAAAASLQAAFTYVSYSQWLLAFRRSWSSVFTDMIRRHPTCKSYYLLLPATVDSRSTENKSNYWMAQMALHLPVINDIRCLGVISNLSDVVRLSQLAEYRRPAQETRVEVLYADDAVFSGGQLVDTITSQIDEWNATVWTTASERQTARETNVVLSVVVGYATTAAFGKIADHTWLASDGGRPPSVLTFGVGHISSVGETLGEYEYERLRGILHLGNARWATYFEGKMPKYNSIIDPLRTGLVSGTHPKKYRPFIRNCPQTTHEIGTREMPLCPAGMYKTLFDKNGRQIVTGPDYDEFLERKRHGLLRSEDEEKEAVEQEETKERTKEGISSSSSFRNNGNKSVVQPPPTSSVQEEEDEEEEEEDEEEEEEEESEENDDDDEY